MNFLFSFYIVIKLVLTFLKPFIINKLLNFYMEENCMKFSWRNLVGVLLIVLGTVVGIVSDVPVVVTLSIASVTVGATLSIAEQVKKTELTGWKRYLFLGATISGTVLLTLGGYSDVVITEIVGAVILIASIIFGIAVDKTKKVEEKKD